MSGCSNPTLPDDTVCDDGDMCTIVDLCQNGVCQGDDLTFFTRSGAKLGRLSQLDGHHLGVNELGGMAKVGSFSTAHDGSLITADTVRLGKNTTVDDVEANNDLSIYASATITGTVSPANLATLPAFCSMPAGSCGGDNVLVNIGQVERLTPDSYGNVTILGGGTLELDPGQYDFCNLRGLSPIAIRPRGNVVIRIHGSFRVGRFGLIEPFAGSTQIWVADSAKFSTGSTVHRTAMNVPDSMLKLGRLMDFDGALCADSLRTGRSVKLGCSAVP